MKSLSIAFFCCLLSITGYAQIDTAFWFAAPDVSSAFNYDRPIYLRITAAGLPCSVVVSEPANPTFPAQTLSIPAGATQSIDLTAWINIIECNSPNTIQPRGLKILSNNKISVYYEANAYGPNPEFFSLKGRNALGTDFFISSQYILGNSPVLTPSPISSFNIVATEDNTAVQITPKQAITGHAANITFTVTLNKGETYAAVAVSQSPSAHLQGSKVSATKPIAITLADDLLQGIAFGGPCEDLAGDQTVPLSVIGSEYIAIRGGLNFPYDKVYITATQDGTTVTQDGVIVATLNTTQSAELSMNTPVSYIQTSLPAYAYQLTGAGCEVGAAILPKITCTGSSSVSVTRSSSEPLYITLLVKNGNQGNFLLNNSTGIITAGQFSVVPFTSGVWYYARIYLDLSLYPLNSVITVKNTSSLFQMGYLTGGTQGAGYGYFSDYNALIAQASISNDHPCSGTNVNLYAEDIPSATYSWNGPGGYTSSSQNPVLNAVTSAQSGNYTVTVTLPGCGTYTSNVALNVVSQITNTVSQTICEGQIYLGYSTTGTYIDHFISSGGCDSARTLNLTVTPKSLSTINASICEGQSYAGHTTTGTYVDTYSAASGCDSIRTLNLTVKPRSFTTNTQSICEGQVYEGHTASGTYISTYTAANGCDSVYTLNLTVKPKSLTTNTQSICEGQVYEGHTATGTYISTYTAANGCDSVYTLNLTVKPKSFSNISVAICEGQVYAGYTAAGTYVDTYIAANGCDSVRTLNLSIKLKSFSNVSAVICEGQTYAGHTVAGTYVDTYVGSNSCDSIRTLTLIVKPKSLSSVSATICEGQIYAGHTTAGVYSDIYPAANGCDSIRTLNLTVKPKSITNNYHSICEGQLYEGHSTSGTYTTTLTAVNGCDSIYNLYLTVNAKTYGIEDHAICIGESYQGHNTTGTFVSTLTNAAGCDSIYTLHLIVNPLPIVKATKSNDVDCSKTKVTLNATGALSYVWSPGATLVNATSPQAIATPAETTIYYVMGTDINGCKNTDSVRVVKKQVNNTLDYIPNAFSPNGDGKNDCFGIKNPGDVKQVELAVYNRWGELVFHTTKVNGCWDGNYKGKPAQEGGYVYYVKAITLCGIIEEKGNIVLLR